MEFRRFVAKGRTPRSGHFAAFLQSVWADGWCNIIGHLIKAQGTPNKGTFQEIGAE
jgi:hypothetical protein